MNNLLHKAKNYFKTFNKSDFIKIGLFFIPFVGIILKGIFLQSFIQNQSPYSFDFSLGYSKSKEFLGYYYAFAFLSLSFSFLFKNKGRIIYTFIIDIFITALTILDVMYFRGFLTVPSVLILTQSANLDHLGGTLISMLSPLDFVFLIDIIVLAIYVFFTRKGFKPSKKKNIKIFTVTLIIPLIYILNVPFRVNVLIDTKNENAYLFDGMDPTNTTKYITSLGYHMMDLYTVYRDSKPYKLSDSEKSDIKDYYDWKNENLPDNSYYGTSKGKNLIVIQVESLEDFIIGKEYNGKKITPNLDNLIQNGLYFPNIFEQVNEGTSSDCDLMINTSLLPLRRGSTFFRYPNDNFNSMPVILQNTGYETASIHPDKGSFWNYAVALKGGINFENFIDYYNFNPDEVIGMGLSDKTYFTQVVPMLKNFKTPFYAHTITLTNHGPFDLPANLRQFSLPPELDKSEMGGYIESVHYTDTQIGNFIDLLDKEGLLDNTVIAITGDHTGVHKYYNYSVEQLSQKEDWFNFNGNPTVPFIIYDKSAKQSHTFDTYGGQIDIMPTLLYQLGIDQSQYKNTALGRSLLNTDRSYAVLTNGTVKSQNLSDSDQEKVGNSLNLSDKMIRANYFN